jgi:hypothetical protein
MSVTTLVPSLGDATSITVGKLLTCECLLRGNQEEHQSLPLSQGAQGFPYAHLKPLQWLGSFHSTT